MVEIATERLRLRELTQADLDDFHHCIGSDADVMKFLWAEQPLTRAESAEVLTRVIGWYSIRGFGVWGLIHKNQNRLIGYCGLQYFNKTAEVEVVYALAQAYWGQGLATEAACAALRFAFEELKLERVVAVARPENIASQRVMERLGMTFEKVVQWHGLDLVSFVCWRADYQPEPSFYRLCKELETAPAEKFNQGLFSGPTAGETNQLAS